MLKYLVFLNLYYIVPMFQTTNISNVQHDTLLEV